MWREEPTKEQIVEIFEYLEEKYSRYPFIDFRAAWRPITAKRIFLAEHSNAGRKDRSYRKLTKEWNEMSIEERKVYELKEVEIADIITCKLRYIPTRHFQKKYLEIRFGENRRNLKKEVIEEGAAAERSNEEEQENGEDLMDHEEMEAESEQMDENANIEPSSSHGEFNFEIEGPLELPNIQGSFFIKARGKVSPEIGGNTRLHARYSIRIEFKIEQEEPVIVRFEANGSFAAEFEESADLKKSLLQTNLIRGAYTSDFKMTVVHDDTHRFAERGFQGAFKNVINGENLENLGTRFEEIVSQKSTMDVGGVVGTHIQQEVAPRMNEIAIEDEFNLVADDFDLRDFLEIDYDASERDAFEHEFFAILDQ